MTLKTSPMNSPITRRAALRACLALSLALSLTILTSCASTPEHTLPQAQAMPAGAAYTGVWYSPQFDIMYLRQIGDSVRGIYTYKYGGTLEGKINGNMLVFDWIDPGDTATATRTRKGKGYLQLVTDDQGNFTLKGRWGYEDQLANGGVWEATYQREIDGEDPRNLEQWRAQEVR